MPKKPASSQTILDTVVINMYVPSQLIGNTKKNCYSIKCEFKLDENNKQILDFLLNKSGSFKSPYNLQYFSSSTYLPLSGQVDVEKVFSSSAKAPTGEYIGTDLRWYNYLRSYEGNDLIQAGEGIYFHVHDKNEITVNWDTSLISAQLLNPVSQKAIDELTNEAKEDESGAEESRNITIYINLNIPGGLIQLYYSNDANESISVGNIQGVTFYGKNSNLGSDYKQISALTQCKVCVLDTCSLNEESSGGAYKKKNRRSRSKKSSKKRKVRKSSRSRSTKRNTKRYRKSRKQNRKH